MRIHDLKIINGQLILRDRIERGDLLINDGQIFAIVKPGISTQEQAEQVIDAKNNLILPGLVDVHVHFRDPGYPEKEDFATGSAAAAAGGVTTITDMPNTQPPTTTTDFLNEKIRQAEKKCIVDYTFHGGPNAPEKLVKPNSSEKESVEIALIDMAKQMVAAGILSFKIYMPNLEAPCIPYLAPLGLPLTIHAEEPQLLGSVVDTSSYGFLASRPPEAEVQAIEKLLKKHPEGSFHICHVSTAEGLRYILNAQNQGISVTSEVTPHHLLLTVKDLSELGPVAKCYPPLRSTSDAQALVEAALTGHVNIIASDHAPHTDTEKGGADANFETAPAGIIGVETALPLMFTKLVRQSHMPMVNLIQMMAYQPAHQFNIRNTQWIEKGQITVGADADLVIFHPKSRYKIRGDALHGKSTLTPFEGWEVSGKVLCTILRGETIYEQEE